MMTTTGMMKFWKDMNPIERVPVNVDCLLPSAMQCELIDHFQIIPVIYIYQVDSFKNAKYSSPPDVRKGQPQSVCA